MEIRALTQRAFELSENISAFLRDGGCLKDGDISGVDYDPADAEETLLLDEMRYISEKLEEVKRVTDYLHLPIMETSVIHLSESGRYETETGFVYTSGQTIEALISDERHSAPYWSVSRVEHDGGRYYIVGHKATDMDGLTIRRRG